MTDAAGEPPPATPGGNIEINEPGDAPADWVDPFEKIFLDNGPPSGDCLEGWTYGHSTCDEDGTGQTPGTGGKPDKKKIGRQPQRGEAQYKDTDKVKDDASSPTSQFKAFMQQGVCC